jgi:hypothetical protein
VKYHNLELGENLLAVIGARNENADRMAADYAVQKKKYGEEAKQIQAEAERETASAERDERRGLRYDIGEGLLEIGLVLTSLYFISRKQMFPLLGVISGVSGLLIAATGLLV